MPSVLVIVLTAVLSSLLTMAAGWMLYQWQIAPHLDKKMNELREQAAALETRVSAGVRQGIRDALLDLSQDTLKSTTRSVVKLGSGLVEGGLSSFFGERGKPGEKP